ncbi:MAG: glutamate--tRNA ligase, partial [Clostridia bacterium]|nr:glutamate--tRNA ligase [Clostridia bacterium]
PDVGGDYGPYVQSERKDMYLPYARELIDKGAAYYCFCSKERLEEARKEAEQKGETFKYDKHCLRLTKEEVQAKLDAGEPYVIRQNIPTTGKAGFDDVIYGHVEVDCDTLDDGVLIKADGLPTYNFANVIDDHTMGITHVMRGNEYLSSAPKYNLLYEAFGWQPPVYVHLTPVMCRDIQKDENGNPVLDENGNPVEIVRKMYKRKGDPSFEDLLSQGYLVDAVINYMALLGWSPRGEEEFFTLGELEKIFDLEGLSKSPSIFDMQKMNWFNAEYIRRLTPEKYMELATPWLDKALKGRSFDYKRLCELLQSRTEYFAQLPGMVAFLAEMPEFGSELYINKKQKSTLESSVSALTEAEALLSGIDDWSEENLHDRVLEKIAALGIKNGQMLWPLRIAVSGQMNTPGGAFEIMYLLGKDETMKRLHASLERLKA